MKIPFLQNNAVDHARDLRESEKKKIGDEQSLSQAQVDAAQAHAAVEELKHVAADPAKVKAALKTKREADDLVNFWADTLAAVDEKILDLQDAVDAIADQKVRVETAAVKEQIAKAVVEAGDAFNISATNYIDVLRQASDIVPDPHDLSAFPAYLTNVLAEFSPVKNLAAQTVRNSAAATLAGTGPAHLPTPESIAPKPSAPPPPPTTQRLFLTQHVAWYDEQGGRHRAPSMHAAELPLTLIAKARQSGAAHDLNSDIQRKHGGTKTSAPPAWEHCKWLNENPLAKSNVEPILHSLSPQFEPHPKPRQTIHGTMPTQAVQPMTATRSNEG
jgi:hypothetical protein